MTTTAAPTTDRELLAMMEPIERMNRDLRHAGRMLSAHQARFFVDFYYQVQEFRKRTANQQRASEESAEPHELVDFMLRMMQQAERNARHVLDDYSDGHLAGVWAKSIIGIGPVISAGLLAHIDIGKAPTVGHIWRFGGLDPTVEWLGTDRARKMVAEVLPPRTRPTAEHLAELGRRTNRRPELLKNLAVKTDGTMDRKSLIAGMARRPWNGKFKVLLWKIGDSITKTSGHDRSVYGPVYASRKLLEEERNEAGIFRAQAQHKLATQNIGRDTEAYKWYSQGKLPPARILLRAQRYATKIFLSHFHHVLYEITYETLPPKPYILTRNAHAHFIRPPNWPMVS